MKINERVYLLESTRGAYAYLVKGKETLLIDTGFSWQGKSILKELASMHIQPQDIKHILLTHYDLDHIGNAAMLQKLTGARLWASGIDLPYITGEKPRPGFKKLLPYIFRIKKPTQLSEYAHEAEIGGVKIIPTPGHTPGHVCMLFEDVLFAGDLFKNDSGTLIPYPKGWNWDNTVLLDSIEAIRKYPFKWICPAHGKPMEVNK